MAMAMSVRQIRKKLTEDLVVSVEDAGTALGLGRTSAYAAAKSGAIPAIKVGGKLIVPTAPLRALLGLNPAGGGATEAD